MRWKIIDQVDQRVEVHALNEILLYVDFYCLKWIADGYIGISHIKSALANNDDIHLSEEDVFHCLLRLITAKLAQPYRYDSATRQYVEVTPSEEEFKGHWFYITKEGIVYLNQNRDKIGQ